MQLRIVLVYFNVVFIVVSIMINSICIFWHTAPSTFFSPTETVLFSLPSANFSMWNLCWLVAVSAGRNCWWDQDTVGSGF